MKTKHHRLSALGMRYLNGALKCKPFFSNAACTTVPTWVITFGKEIHPVCDEHRAALVAGHIEEEVAR